MRLYHAKNKKVLRIKNSAADFLGSFSTNTPEAPRGAFIDLKGNIVAVFEQVPVDRQETLIAIERQFTGRLLSHLDKYLKIGDTVITEENYRVYYDLESPAAIPPPLITTEALPAEVSEEEFTRFRIARRLPLQGVDYDAPMVLNVGEDLVSFTKGCYLGQEIVARVHYRGSPPKKLLVKSLEQCTAGEAAAMTSRTTDPSTGKTIGFVFVNNP